MNYTETIHRGMIAWCVFIIAFIMMNHIQAVESRLNLLNNNLTFQTQILSDWREEDATANNACVKNAEYASQKRTLVITEEKDLEVSWWYSVSFGALFAWFSWLITEPKSQKKK